MKKQRYFKNEDSEQAFTAEYFYEEMREEGLTEMEVMEAVPDRETKDYRWCTYFESVGEASECGKVCGAYAPRNGKNGICKHQGHFCTHGEKVTLKLPITNKQ